MAQTRAIVGTVVADSAGGHPIENAEVMAPAVNVSARTNATGEFRLAGLAPGRQMIVVRLIGYRTIIDSVEAGADAVLIDDLERMGRDVKPPDLSPFLVTDLAGVEFYPGQASLPVQFKSGQCGTLLLWTREK